VGGRIQNPAVDDDMVDVYIDGRFYFRTPRKLFELEYEAAKPVRDFIKREVEKLETRPDATAVTCFEGTHSCSLVAPHLCTRCGVSLRPVMGSGGKWNGVTPHVETRPDVTIVEKR